MLSKDWELLRNHESFELVKRDYFQRHGREPNTAHARELAAPFTHARSYFAAARDSDQTVRPLLLYYGVVSLSRGLTMTLEKGRREATLAQAHGLTVKDWQHELGKPNPDFASLGVFANRAGTLIDLGNATEHRSLLRAGSSATNYNVQFEGITNTDRYTLGDLLARAPSLQESHRRWRGFSRCAPLKDIEAADSVVFRITRASYFPWITRNFCELLFLDSGCSFDNDGEDFFAYRGSPSNDFGISDKISEKHFGIGDLWGTAVYPFAHSLSKITTLFTLSYILGMLVRYYPTQWTALIHSQIGDAALPTIAGAIDLIEVEYPRTVVDFLSEPVNGE